MDDGEPPLPFGAAPEDEALEENRAVPTRLAPSGELGDADALPAFGPDDVAGFGAARWPAAGEGCSSAGRRLAAGGAGPHGCGQARRRALGR